MMKFASAGKTFVAACLITLAMSALAAAGENRDRSYFSVSGGVFMPSESTITSNTGKSSTLSFKSGYTASVTTGKEFVSGGRPEFEFTYKKADTDKLKYNGASAPVTSSTSLIGFMANIFYDFRNTSSMTPYIGAGIGGARVSVDSATSVLGFPAWSKDESTVVAYQVGTGVAFAATEDIALDLGYRYYATFKPQFQSMETEFASHNIQAGIRFQF